MLHSRGLNYVYTKGREIIFPDLDVAKAESVLIIGPSGCGKSTFLHLCAGLIRNYKGSLKIGGIELLPLNENDLDQFRGQHIGLASQESIFVKSLTVIENLMLFQKIARKSIDVNRCKEVLHVLGLSDYIHKKTYELSVGERQRLMFARTILNKPALILADEPTAALDDKNAEIVANILVEMAGSIGSALVIATHDARLKNIFSNQVLLS